MKPSVRTLVTLIALLPAAITALLLVWIGSSSSRRIADDLGDQLLRTSTVELRSEIRNFLGDAMRVSDLFLLRVQQKRLPIDRDLESWLQPMLDEMATTPNLAAITFGHRDGRSTYLQIGHEDLEWGVSAGSGPGQCVERLVLRDGTVGKETRRYQYDPPGGRPWYRDYVNQPEPRWTDVYFWFGDDGGDATTGVGYTRRVEVDGQFVGMMVVDVTLQQFAHYLSKLPIAESGSIFVIDSEGYIVAASNAQSTTPEGQRAAFATCESRVARAIVATQHDVSKLRDDTIYIDGERTRVSVTPCAPYPGVDWRVVAVLPETAFLAEAHDVQRRSIWLALGTLLLGGMLGLMLASRLTVPLMALAKHVRNIGQGDFESTLKLGAARELDDVADELNRMSGDLKGRLELLNSARVASDVQQSLLPRTNPRVPGLDIYGTTRLRDRDSDSESPLDSSASLDILDMASTREQHLVLAIGDALSHGEGTAMLMGSARGALRAALVGNQRLDAAMERVNRTLCTSPGNHLFMSLLLMRVDPKTGEIIWSSAGHDPAIVYDSHEDKFVELEGAEIPLGKMEDVDYRTHSHAGFASGQVLFVGTDGIWETRNAQGEEFGKQRLQKLIRENALRPSVQIGREIEAAIAEFRGEAPTADDLTYVVVRYV
jgi:serine phosphatase RsbU (regulator of sigma subunit)